MFRKVFLGCLFLYSCSISPSASLSTSEIGNYIGHLKRLEFQKTDTFLNAFPSEVVESFKYYKVITENAGQHPISEILDV